MPQSVFLLLDLGPHAAFILSSYGTAAAVVAVLVLWAIFGERAQQRRIEELERLGLTRGGSANKRDRQ